MFKNKTIRYSLEENEILKTTRDISFEDVIIALEEGFLLDDIEHPNQNIFIILRYRQKFSVNSSSTS